MSEDHPSTKPPPEPQRTGGPRWLQSLRSRLGLSGPQTLRQTLEEALKSEAKAESTLSAAERDMMLRLLRFGAMRVDDVMVPRADITSIDETASIGDLLALFRQAGVSRIPLYAETLDDPRGMVHIKDLVRYLMGDAAPREPAADGKLLDKVDLGRADVIRQITGAKLRRPMLYVPPSMPAMNLLLRMQATRIHMALIVDEYGGTDGLVTIEDLVEQVVGDIEDEHDVAEAAQIVADPVHGLVAEGRTPIAEIEKRLGATLLTPEEVAEIDTIGGLVVSMLGRVPSRGEVVRHQATGLEFEILDADPRRIKKLKLLPRRDDTAEPATAAPQAAGDTRSAAE